MEIFPRYNGSMRAALLALAAFAAAVAIALPPADAAPPPGRTASHTLVTVSGESPRSGPGRLYRYVVQVERGLKVGREAFADEVQRTLFDPRSWSGTGRVAFKRVPRGARTQIILASPRTVDRLCAPLRTAGTYSCQLGQRVVLNYRRWMNGAPSYRGNLGGYRRMLVNHEVGHRLGLGHRSCPGRGRLAPVMMQQTKGLGGCRANPWPLGSERKLVR